MLSKAQLQFGPGSSAGGGHRQTAVGLHERLASIRPRLFSRGGPGKIEDATMAFWALQFGPGSSAGGDVAAGDLILRADLLQFGPGSSAGGGPMPRSGTTSTTTRF